jgi:hypothetical protein
MNTAFLDTMATTKAISKAFVDYCKRTRTLMIVEEVRKFQATS